MKKTIGKLIQINGENKSSISILVNSYENLEDIDEWLSCDIKIVLNSFSASYNASIQKCDFNILYKILDELLTKLSGEMDFEDCEGSLKLRFIFKLGKVYIEGQASDITSNCKLVFYFESDQTYLQITKAQLRKLIEENN